MNHEQFIANNIQAELVKIGFSSSIADMASDKAVDYYRRSSSASRKGKMYDDCLHIAKAWASKYSKVKPFLK
ncbi:MULTISPECIES: hypothetical protein [Photorhabdus]|uniref:hypothetical protein n=1 Tax=Photorhabdus TaxID=29487 RepID=UPI0007B4EBBE|nr:MULTISPECIES: hypothetical protein [Photorhabdus]MCC8389260.1 hypothetical protein [Photorhabdus laumondii]AXG42236.1 hypothetical protein PluDJC_08210 [Photorhabdus laumondii subsp. laumondii]MCZ1250582.1 hypothetical protein [Photorhabdus laumondii subsp. laumondii]NDL16077.1 hypothetical protein [Photorhabdus laumondii subsp. laumondii]NDL47261.1 hypothetical protein [Photorhabdus laumondii subsp. laumondii]